MDQLSHNQEETSTSIVIPPAFTLAQYRLVLEAIEPLKLPPIKGSALRGGFGHTFKRLACLQPWPCDKYCQQGNTCPYGYIFETAPPEQSDLLRNFDDVPRPFIIESAGDARTYIPPDDMLTFGLTLVGRGADYQAHFEAVFRELGRVGLGQSKGKYRLLSMDRTSEINGAYIADQATTLPTDRLTLDFLSPTRLKFQGRWVWEGPPFAVLVRTLLGRTSSLSYFHCGERLEVDFRELIDRAAGIKIVQSKTRWEDWARVSGRQKQEINMGGLVGQVTYAGEIGEYLPLLVLGELIHVGKGTVFGNGQYRIVDRVTET